MLCATIIWTPRCRLLVTSSILDVDLDYFAIVDKPIKRLHDLLKWASRPVDFIFFASTPKFSPHFVLT
jgi:hypothetical protein